MLERRMDTTIGNQSHEMDADTPLFCILERRNDFGILQYRIVAASAVDFHQILIDDTTGTDIEVSDLRVAHLSLGQTHVLTVGAQFGVGYLAVIAEI